MRFVIPVLAILALFVVSTQAQAKSCSSFAVLKSYDADAKTVEVDFTKGDEKKFFPKPEGTPRDRSRIPERCRRSVLGKQTSLEVRPTGTRMTITQVRANFEGQMLNDIDDPNWVPAKLNELIEGETEVVLIIRPGAKRNDPLALTTIYLPITEEELAEIKRREDEAVDVD